MKNAHLEELENYVDKKKGFLLLQINI